MVDIPHAPQPARRPTGVDRVSLTLEPAPDTDAPGKVPLVEDAPTRSRNQHVGAKLLAKRAGIYLVTFWGAVTVNFFIPRIMPGDPTQETVQRLQARTGQVVPPATVKAIGAILGNSNDNIVVQYVRYWNNLLHGNLGLSVSHYPIKVTTLIGNALPWTVGLVTVAILVAWLIGVVLGAIGGWNRGRRSDTAITLFAAVMIAVPSFWAALILQYLLAYKFNWLPAGGSYDPDLIPSFTAGYVFSILKYALLPGMTLAFVSFSGFYFAMRNQMATTVADDYVLLAKAKGLSQTRVLVTYAARNAILPSVASLASSIGGAVGGVVIIESIFTYPGLGSLMVSGIGAFDFPLIQGVFLVITSAVLIMNFIADSIYVLVDPRTREGSD